MGWKLHWGPSHRNKMLGFHSIENWIQKIINFLYFLKFKNVESTNNTSPKKKNFSKICAHKFWLLSNKNRPITVLRKNGIMLLLRTVSLPRCPSSTPPSLPYPCGLVAPPPHCSEQDPKKSLLSKMAYLRLLPLDLASLPKSPFPPPALPTSNAPSTDQFYTHPKSYNYTSWRRCIFITTTSIETTGHLKPQWRRNADSAIIFNEEMACQKKTELHRGRCWSANRHCP